MKEAIALSKEYLDLEPEFDLKRLSFVFVLLKFLNNFDWEPLWDSFFGFELEWPLALAERRYGVLDCLFKTCLKPSLDVFVFFKNFKEWDFLSSLLSSLIRLAVELLLFWTLDFPYLSYMDWISVFKGLSFRN